MKKVYLIAYDKVNLGDDLFIRSIVGRYPDVKFYMWSNLENKRNFNDIKNLKVINENSYWFRLLSRIRASLVPRIKSFIENRCDAIVYIGGSIFIEYPTWRNIVNWWNYEVNKNNFYIIGANFGPYKSDEYKDAMGLVFSKAKDVCFRDTYSYNLFKNAKKVRMAPDILFGMKIKDQVQSNKQIFISVINNENRDIAPNYSQMMINFVNEANENGYTCILSSFCKLEGDENMVDFIFHNTDNQTNIKICNYNGNNADQIIECIQNSEFVVASRFHATILGLLAKKKVMPLIYSDKTKNVLDDIGYNEYKVDLRLDECIDFDKFLKISNNTPIDQLTKDSVKHFSKLDSFLDNSEDK